jgi:hypothetical protein
VAIVNSRTPGKLQLLLVDLTQNAGGFEHQASHLIASTIKNRGVALALEAPLQLKSIDEYSAALQKYDPDFNALLIFAHGKQDQSDGTASKVLHAPQGVSNFFDLAAHSYNLKDKFVALCVCHGYCEDAKSALVDDNSMCLTLMAPTEDLTKIEAETFFPIFFAELNVYSTTSIDPNDVRTVMKKLNCLAGDKMKVYSEGLSDE